MEWVADSMIPFSLITGIISQSIDALINPLCVCVCVCVCVCMCMCVLKRELELEKKRSCKSAEARKKTKKRFDKRSCKKKNWRGSRTTCERSNEQTRDSESEIKRRKMGIWHIAFSTATTNEDERAAAATREKREKKHFKWIKYTLTLCFCLSRAAPLVPEWLCVCVWYCVGWKKKMANCHAFPLCVWYSSLQLVSCLCAILQAIQLILSLCIFLAIPLQQSELCFYYYCVSVGFALCDIPFFFFFFSCF